MRAVGKNWILAFFADYLNLWFWLERFCIFMASSGSLELGAENPEYCVNENISTHNRYEKLGQRQDGGDSENDNENEWNIQDRKRKRQNTGSNSSSVTKSFSSMSTDDKLDVIFSKLLSIEKKQSKMENIEDAVKGMSRCKTRLGECENKINVLGYRSLDLEARSRRKNLIFRGLFETRNENCTDRIYEFLYDQFDIEAERIVIERAHRLGPWKRTVRKRPIIVAFRDYPSTELILNEAYQLRGTRYSIDKDYPAEIVKARRLLWNRYRQVKSISGEKVKMVYPAKIMVGRRVVEDAFPGWNSILKSERVEPVISEAIEKLNKECDEARNKDKRQYGGHSSEQGKGQGHTEGQPKGQHSERARNNSYWGNMLDSPRTERPAKVGFSDTGSSGTGSIQGSRYTPNRANTGGKQAEKRGSDDTCIDMDSDGDDKDEDDRVFYSDYVSSRMNNGPNYNHKDKTPQKRPADETPKTPQIVTMKDFRLLCPASPANVSNQRCKSNSNGNNSNTSAARQPSEKTMKKVSVTSQDSRDPVSDQNNRGSSENTGDTNGQKQK